MEDLAIGDLLFFREVVAKMLESDSNIRGACEAVRKERFSLNVAEDKFKRVRDSIASRMGADPFQEIGGKGRNQRVTKDSACRRKLDDVLRQLDKIFEAKTKIEVQSQRIESSEVRIGTIVSIANYFGPALIQRIRCDADERGKRVPHIAMFHGDLRRHLEMLLEGELDFLIHHHTLARLPRGVASFPLQYRAMERGIVFRRFHENGRKVAFPKLVKALEQGNIVDFVDELDSSPILLFHGSDDPIDELRNKLFDKFVQPSGRTREKGGQRIFMPTIRSERQLIQMGLGVGFSHKPLVKKSGAFRHKCAGLEITSGFDPEFPQVELLYVPIKILNEKNKSSFDTPPIRFGLYARSDDEKFEIKTLAEPVMNVCRAVLSILDSPDTKYGYLEFSKREGEPQELLHSFHFVGYSATSLESKR